MLKKIILISCLLVMLTGVMLPTVAKGQQAEVTLDDQQIMQINAALEDENKDLPIDEKFRVHVEPNNLSQAKGLDKAWLNILLMGTDTGDIRLNFGRTDAMLVLSINTQTGQIKLTSLVRDMLVSIPGYNIKNRINTANAFGGPLLAMKTVNEVLGLNIERYCSINFSGFEDVVDYLGGVSMVLSSAEAGTVNARRTEEAQLLTGEQALMYVRIRHLDNNFGRNERQRKFLSAVLEQTKQSSFDQIIDAVAAGFQTIATNLTTSEVIALLPSVIQDANTMDTLSLPQEGAYTFSTTSAGASVIEFDADAVKEAFHAFVYGN